MPISDEPRCTKVEMGEVCGEPQSTHYSLTHAFQNAGVAQSEEQVTRTDKVADSTSVSSSKYICNMCKEDIEPDKTSPTKWRHVKYNQDPVENTHPHEKLGLGASWPEPKLIIVESQPKEKHVGLSEEQRSILANIVRHRIQLEDAQKLLDKNKKMLEDNRKTWNATLKELTEKIERYEQVKKADMAQLEAEENKLRNSILNDVTLGRIPEEEKEVEQAPEEPEFIDIGRVE